MKTNQQTGLPGQQDHPLAPNCPLGAITWRQAPAEPHGYYERTAYAKGWNDAVSKLTPILQVRTDAGWLESDIVAYQNTNPEYRRIVYLEA